MRCVASTMRCVASTPPPPPMSWVASIMYANTRAPTTQKLCNINCVHLWEHYQVLSPSPQCTTQKFRSTNRVCKLKVRALPPSMNRVASTMCGFGTFFSIDGTTWQTLISIGCHRFTRAVFVATGWTLAQNS